MVKIKRQQLFSQQLIICHRHWHYSIPQKSSDLDITDILVVSPQIRYMNASFPTGIVPYDLKLANVVPVYKKGSQTSLSNYRPISLLSIFNKLQERLMYNRMIKFLEKNDIFYTKQFGFRSKHSTDHDRQNTESN